MLRIKLCPTCGSKRIRKVKRTVVRQAPTGKRYTVPNLEFWECSACGERLYGPEASRKIDAHSPTLAKALKRRTA